MLTTRSLVNFADKPPTKSTLQRNLKRVRAETLERVNRALVEYAQAEGVEDGQRLRSDSTVIKAAIHEDERPSTRSSYVAAPHRLAYDHRRVDC